MTGIEYIFTNAQVVTADRTFIGNVVVRDEVMVAVDEGRSAVRDAIDCDGDLLIPGLIELHTDNVERHIQPRPGAFWPLDAAIVADDRELVGCGITTVLNALCVGEVHSRTVRAHGLLRDITDALSEQIKRGRLKADHYVHWRCEISYQALPEILAPLMEHPRLKLMSIMDHTPGQRQFVDIARYAEYYQGKFNMSDAELSDFIQTRTESSAKFAASNRRYVVEAAKARDVPLASHDDATLDHVREAIDDGVAVAEFPTTIESARASHAGGLQVLMGAPNIVRGKSHSGNVSATELARLGYLDIISSDYVPSSLLWSALKVHHEVGLALHDAIATVTRNPARAMGFHDRGEIKPGLRADLVRVRDTGGVPIIEEVWSRGQRVA